MIILGIGSNLSSSFGDRFQNILKALSFLKSSNVEIIKISSFYETPSYPDKSNPKFINVVVCIKTHLKPLNLMQLLLSVENKLGRLRIEKNGPRTCDLDIIDYNNEVIEFVSENMIFFSPHQKLSNRNFVLYPLKEIQPLWKHPVTNETIDTLISKLPFEDKKSILKIKNLL